MFVARLGLQKKNADAEQSGIECSDIVTCVVVIVLFLMVSSYAFVSKLCLVLYLEAHTNLWG